MEYHTLFFSKIKKDVENLSSAAVVIGALRVKAEIKFESVTYGKFSFAVKD